MPHEKLQICVRLTSLCSTSATRLSTWHCLCLLLSPMLWHHCCWVLASATVDQYVLSGYSAANALHTAATAKWWDGWMLCRYIAPGLHTLWAMSIMSGCQWLNVVMNCTWSFVPAHLLCCRLLSKNCWAVNLCCGCLQTNQFLDI